ncbi:MAG TPA: RNA 2',3'-cyclic phosphodiesterase [Gaiellaceae bacterium]|nr:RNA 2',3'-cyclic phosphodiesterase [Gaiellaceae bacterium]
MGGDERLRLFLALQLPDDTVRGIAEWQQQELRGRIVPAGNLHVTLAFLGSRPAAELDSICGVLEEEAAAAASPQLADARYRETRTVGMLAFSDATGNGAVLAARLHERLLALGVYEPEPRAWLPHVTVLRYRERPGLSPAPPELPVVTPSDAAAFVSRLHPSGAVYEVLESFPLNRQELNR